MVYSNIQLRTSPTLPISGSSSSFYIIKDIAVEIGGNTTTKSNKGFVSITGESLLLVAVVYIPTGP